MNDIMIAVMLLVVLGLVIGLFLGAMSKVFEVKVDEKVSNIRALLPGNNCGSCGYAGCDQLAQAIAEGKALANSCPVGGEKVAKEIAQLIGANVGDMKPKVAFVHCNGSCTNTTKVYNYTSTKTCQVAVSLANGGDKSCRFACIGFGDCVKECKFDAIHIVDGVSKVDANKCKGCGACTKVCPVHVIDLIDKDKKHVVRCANKEIGKIATKVCKASCIACKLCEKNCPQGAIIVKDNLAQMDYTKCNDCGVCSEKCPRKAIV